MDFFVTRVTDEAKKLVSQTVETGWLSEGKRVAEFESRLTADLGFAHPVAVNSGTSALELALHVAGVSRGDEVILPPQTFVASGLAIINVGATPVFADINPDTGNISPKSIAEQITDRTAAVMPVHWGGYPCDMDEIGEIATDAEIAVVEDAAHAVGATYKSKPIGAISNFTCFSFQAIKHLTTGDGGAVCCIDPDDENKAKAMRWFGIDRANSRPSVLGEREFDVTGRGFKFHMNDLAASMGIGNLHGLGDRLERRNAIASTYLDRLADVGGITLLKREPDRTHANWLFTMRAENREGLIRKLSDAEIPSSVVHQRIDRFSVLGGVRTNFRGQEQFESSQLSIPVHEGLTDKDVDRVVGVIKSGW